MTDARTEVLARVRAALARPATPGLLPAVPGTDVPRAYRTTGDDAPGSPGALEMLVDRLVDYRAEVTRVDDDAQVGAAVAAALRTHLPGATASADDPPAVEGAGPSVVVPPGLDPAWTAALDPAVRLVADSRDDPRTPAELDAVDAVVTAARVAIAQTGTIVLDGEPDQGRRAITLVPDLHVCVVRAAQVVASVPEAVRLLGAHPERPQTWVSGPSATSDIELQRVEGVHGPRTLHVVLVG